MRIAAIAAVVALGLSAPAMANGYYVEGFGGWTTYPDHSWDGTDYEMEDGYNLGASVGRAFSNSQLSAEAEVFYTNGSYEGYDDEETTLSLMANLYYNMVIANTVSAYIGGGIGFARLRYEDNTDEWDGNGFAYQFIGGILVPVANNVSLFGEYRYQDGAEIEIDGEDVDWGSHNISGGLRFQF